MSPSSEEKLVQRLERTRHVYLLLAYSGVKRSAGQLHLGIYSKETYSTVIVGTVFLEEICGLVAQWR